MYGLESSSRFLKAVRAITNTVSTISDEEIVKCYRRFLQKLESYFRSKSIKQFDSIAIIKLILVTDVLYHKVEVIVHCICTASVKVSVESVVETLVSRYEQHFDSSRQLTEDHALEEMQIAENGPLLQHADSLLDRSMNNYWKSNNERGQWHFIRRTEDIRSYTGGSSKVLGKMLDDKSKLPFMDM